MIPYFAAPALKAGPFTIRAFGVLMTSAIVLGGYIMIKRAGRMGVSRDLMFRASFWALACGLAGAHVTKFAMESTAVLLSNPFIILRTSRGIRSLGGLSCGLLGALAYCRLRGLSSLEMFRLLDVMAYALPFAWMIGRLGCTLAHDHRGLPSTSWIAVQFPDGPRFDLGLIEFLFLIGLSALFYWLDREPRPVGFFFGLFGILYGLFRVWLDTLHMQPMRFFGGLLGCVVGIAGWMVMTRIRAARQRELVWQSTPPS